MGQLFFLFFTVVYCWGGVPSGKYFSKTQYWKISPTSPSPAPSPLSPLLPPSATLPPLTSPSPHPDVSVSPSHRTRTSFAAAVAAKSPCWSASDAASFLELGGTALPGPCRLQGTRGWRARRGSNSIRLRTRRWCPQLPRRTECYRSRRSLVVLRAVGACSMRLGAGGLVGTSPVRKWSERF